jgi:hypothetical protein
MPKLPPKRPPAPSVEKYVQPNPGILVRMTPAEIALVDAWAAKQPEAKTMLRGLSRPAAIRKAALAWIMKK